MRAPFLPFSGLILNLSLMCIFFQPSLSPAAETNNEIVSYSNQNLSKAMIHARQTALEKSEKLSLSKHETWLALLHYKQETVSQKVLSQVDDETFFFHREGRVDAKGELTASINVFFKEPHSGHAQCLFPARWWWLKQQLNLGREYDVECPQLEAFMSRMAGDKLILVFPTMYLNNPGSTFGHTFLRFDTEGKSKLLSQTLNYAARTNKQDNIFNYVRKGLFGGYTGFFRMRSYFETVQEYNNIENRDIWEYELAFTKDEIKQLLRHVWEINNIDFDYFFFKENCAYRLLALLDVVREGMKLTTEDKFSVYAIPVDTVRALDDLGLIESRKLRASLVTRIDNYFLNNEGSIRPAVEIATKESMVDPKSISNYLSVVESDIDKVQVLQQSHNILQFYNASTSTKAQTILELANNFKNLEKSKVNVENGSENYGKLPPEKGHDSARVSVGFGKQNTRQYIDLRLRPAFHDLMDSTKGYIDGAAINSFEARFKWFTSTDVFDGNRERSSKLRLESLSFLNITSLNPFRHWHKPLSWLIDIRFDRTQVSEARSLRNFLGKGGLGVSFKKRQFIPFMMMMGEGNLSSDYNKGYSFLLGLRAGMQLSFTSNRLMMSYQADKAISGFDLDRGVTELQWQYDLWVNHGVRLRYKRSGYDFFDDEDWSVNYHYYF